jgi:outer membrane protein assembly factor BamD
MRLTILYLSAFFLLLFASCNGIAKIQKSTDFEYKLKKADEFFEKKKYRFAQQLYEELFPVFKGTQKFEELYYRYAYCFYYQRMYRDAEQLFQGYLEVFPNSVHAEEIDYMRAYSYYKISPRLELEQVSTLRAMSMMQSFINTHPSSKRVADATAIMDELRLKLEKKEFRSAELYYRMGEYRASSIAFAQLLNNYPESPSGDMYKLMVIRSCFRFAKMSIFEKQEERFEKVTTEYLDFLDRYPDSPLLQEAETLSNQSKQQIKNLKYEQNSSTPQP